LQDATRQAPSGERTMAIRAANPELAVDKQRDRQPEEDRARRKHETTSSTAGRLAKVPSQKLPQCLNTLTEGLDQQGGERNVQDRPRSNQPVQPSRRGVEIGACHKIRHQVVSRAASAQAILSVNLSIFVFRCFLCVEQLQQQHPLHILLPISDRERQERASH
jgi:hypothetical protein